MNEETIDEFDDDPSLEEKSNVYSKQLKDLVTRCSSRKPEDRPQPEDLLQQIRKWTSGERDLVSGLRTNVEPRDDEMDWEYISVQDPYPVGMSLVDLQRRQDEKKRREQEKQKEMEMQEKERQKKERQELERQERERQEKQKDKQKENEKMKEKPKQTKPPRPYKPRPPFPPPGGSTSGGFGGGSMFFTSEGPSTG